jgi:hypothetical protein
MDKNMDFIVTNDESKKLYKKLMSNKLRALDEEDLIDFLNKLL